MTTNLPPGQRTITPLGRRASVLTLVALLVSIGLVGLFWLALRATPATPPIDAASDDIPAVAAEASAAHDEGDIVAYVNGQPLLMRDARRVQAIDRAMAQALGQNAGFDDLVERLINAELVAQAIDAAAFAVPASEIDAAFEGFLSAQNISEAMLAQALAADGLSLADLRDYFGDLVALDQFARGQAAAQNITVSAYIENLQTQARISFGPGATALATTAAVAVTAIADETGGQAEAQPPATPAMSAIVDASAIAQFLETDAPPVEARPDAEASTDARGILPGQLAPDFSLPALNSPEQPALTHADLLGQPAVLSFWTTWCPYCRRQTPVLVAAAETYATRGIQFVGIDVKESQTLVEAYLAEHGITYPIALDASGEIAGRYQVRGFPTTYFLDAEGRVIAHHVGALTPERLESYLQTLLAQPD